MIAAILGNVLETYDFLIYSFFAIQIGHALFAEKSAFISLMLSLATFGVGFVTRPVGAIAIGAYADRAGRRPAMMLCFMLMGSAILVLALTPSYRQIGIGAPVLAVLSRLLQGFSLGGEIGSNTTFLLEAAPPSQRAFCISWQGVGQMIALSTGSIVGIALITTMSPAALDAYGWRIAFLLGAATLPVGIWLRSRLPETLNSQTADLLASRLGSAPSLQNWPQLQAARRQWRIILLGFVIVATGTIGSYTTIYVVTYAQNTLHLPANTAFAAEMCNSLLSIPAMLAGGWLSDRYGRWPVNVGGSLLYLLAILPVFIWLVHARSNTALVIGMSVLGLAGCLNTGSFYASLGESLPPIIRVSAYGTIYALGVALLGGSTQLVATWLIKVTGSAMAPAWYLVGATAIGQIAFVLFPETAPCRKAQLGNCHS